MRMISICLAVAATPALAETTLSITPTTPEAAADAQALSGALLSALAPGGGRDDCPLTVTEGGSVVVEVSHVPGPPAGWALVLGPADAPLYATAGATGAAAEGATGILEALCPKEGGAATVGPWTASSGSLDGKTIVITGTVQDLLAPFTLEGVFPGGQAVFEYIPVNIGGGPVTYALSGSGVTGSGEGLYSLEALPGGVYRLVQTTEGCVDGIANSCRTNTDTVTLTPIGQ